MLEVDDNNSCYIITLNLNFVDRLTCNPRTPTPGRCGFNQTGNLVDGGHAIDGVMGLGLGTSSLISQLASGEIVDNAFAHCLGGEEGGGRLVLGRTGEPGMEYTKLLKSESG